MEKKKENESGRASRPRRRSGSNKANQTRVLPVHYARQVSPYGCFSACAHMVLRFYGKAISQSILRKACALGKSESDVRLGVWLAKKGFSVVTYWNGTPDGFDTPASFTKQYEKDLAASRKIITHKRGMAVDGIKRLVARRVPVIAEVESRAWYHQPADSTHTVLVVGFDANHLIVHDPHHTAGAPWIAVPIGYFKKAWERIDGNESRSAFVILKRKRQLR